MKFIKTILVLFSVLQFSVTLGQDLQRTMDRLRKQEKFYEYWDEEGRAIYAYGWIEQIYGIPVFRSVSFDEASQEVTIDGITTMTGLVSDTLERGYCPFAILVARPDSNHVLLDVRKLATTYCQSTDPRYKDGYFGVKFRIKPGDILIIGNPGRAGSGAIVYNIYKLLDSK